VLRLLANDHTFYEGAYRTQVHFGEQQLGTLTGRFAFPFIQFGYVRSVVDATPERGRILELGCGSGVQLFGDLFDVVATDLSHQSLAETPVRYQARVQADVLDVEFSPGCFDTICASCFFEHFTGEQKDRLLERCLRWLRPEGALVLLFDTESANPVIRRLRREPDLYRKAFIETDGHVGLEPPGVNLERFERAGFVLESGIGLNRSLQRLPLYIWLDAYRERFGWAGPLAALGRRMSENRVLNRVYSASLHVWDHSIGRLFPESWSTLYLGVWRKPGGDPPASPLGKGGLDRRRFLPGEGQGGEV
jgi:SAM-dependent methyltransferase